MYNKQTQTKKFFSKI